MSTDKSGWNAIVQYSFLRVFANDGVLDRDELAMLERLALADGAVDARERSVLSRIFERASRVQLDPVVEAAIARFKAQHGID